jgi:hypothetical protein
MPAAAADGTSSMCLQPAILALSAATDVCMNSIVSPIAVLEIDCARTDCASKIQEYL